MKLRVFGNSSDDKGTQLERLTKRLLEGLGYQQVALNVVGSGGSEVDIRAEFRAPGLDGEITLHLIGECKAYDSTVTLPDWLKFLGKLYLERLKPQNVRGIYIALSGVNGNLSGAYDDFRVHDQTVDLISGEKLAQHVVREFKLPDVSSLEKRVGRLTTDNIAQISLGYRNDRAFWIVEFVNESFAVFMGDSLSEPPSDELIQTISNQIQAAKYRDLSHEMIAQNRVILARKHVLGQLILGRSISADLEESLFPPNMTPSQSDISAAIRSLRTEGKIVTAEGVDVLPDLLSNISKRAEILREIVTGICLWRYIGNDHWDALVDEDLLQESLRIKDGLVIEQDARAKAVLLMRWSPSALMWALTPDPILCGQRGKNPQLDERMLPEHARYYLLQIVNLAAGDFRNPQLHGVLHDHYGLQEMQTTQRVVFKSRSRSEVEIELAERIGIFQAAPDIGGGLVQVWLLKDSPEPWAGIEAAEEGLSSQSSSSGASGNQQDLDVEERPA